MAALLWGGGTGLWILACTLAPIEAENSLLLLIPYMQSAIAQLQKEGWRAVAKFPNQWMSGYSIVLGTSTTF